MILKREKYLRQIRPFYSSDIIKVITGVRGAGKSALLQSVMDELSAEGICSDHIIYLNFEDPEYACIADASDLDSEIKSRLHDDRKYFIFLDEIRHVSKFEKALASLMATLNVSIFVTAGCSTLLSGDPATLLTGRTVEFELLPFSFSEMRELFSQRGWAWPDDNRMFLSYLRWGGLPGRFFCGSDAEAQRYLSNLFMGIVRRNVTGISGSAAGKDFREIPKRIMAGIAVKNPSVIAAEISAAPDGVSRRTVYNYLGRMKNACLIRSAGRYDIARRSCYLSCYKERLYAADTGFISANAGNQDPDYEFLLKNAVFSELISRGFSVFTGKTRSGEVDFAAVRDGRKCLIQVAYLLDSEESIRREFGAYSRITDASPRYVMSLDRFDLSHDGIVHLNIIDFLLGKRDLFLT